LYENIYTGSNGAGCTEIIEGFEMNPEGYKRPGYETHLPNTMSIRKVVVDMKPTVFIIPVLLVMAPTATATLAYAMTIGPNGTTTVTERGPNNITATITAPPGTTVGPVTITPLINGQNFIIMSNTHWTIMNESSGSVGTITFNESCHPGKVGDVCKDTFTRFLNGRTLTGVGVWPGLSVGEPLDLCYGHKVWYGLVSQPGNHMLPGCTSLTLTRLSFNHLEFNDIHGDTIRLMR
jgi:hypothetical protein